MEIIHDAAPAAWLVDDADWWRAVTIGPAGFEAYARLRLIPDPTRPGQTENDVEIADDHPTDLAQILRLVELLTPWTTTPDDAHVALWDGWPWDDDLRRRWGRPAVENDVRSFHLMHGRLDELREWTSITGGDENPPAFIWPRDRAWCITLDVDPHWAGIGASRAAIDTLVGASHDASGWGLDIVETTRDADHPFFF